MASSLLPEMENVGYVRRWSFQPATTLLFQAQVMSCNASNMDGYYKVDPIYDLIRDRKNIEWGRHRNMDRTELMEVSFYTDATPDFLHDVVFTGSDRIKLQVKQHKEPSVYSPLRLVLLEVYQVCQQYGSHRNSSPLDVWEMV
jgi:hypothetical protein